MDAEPIEGCYYPSLVRRANEIALLPERVY